MDLEISGVKIKIEIIRSNRRSTSVAIVGRGLLKVRCTTNTSEKAILKLIHQHWDYLFRKLQDYSEISELDFNNNSEVFFKGKKLKVIERLGLSKPMQISEYQLQVLPRLNPKQRKEAYVRLCQREARKLITELVEKYISITGLKYNNLRMKDTSSRWGSCSSDKNLNFNWRLILAGDEVIEYVVVHEVCHLKHPNHGIQFWQMVGNLFPDYRIASRWLKRHGHTLVV